MQTRELVLTLESEAQSGLLVPSRRAAQCELNGRDSRYPLGGNDTLTDRDLPIQDIPMAEEHRSCTDRRDTVDSEGGHSRWPMLLPNGSRLSCGALEKESSFNILCAPPASSAC